MEIEDSKGVVRPRRNIEVLYVPDEVIETIIPNENVKLDGRRRRNTTTSTPINDYVGFNRVSGAKPKLSRSGRQITSQLQSLSLNETSSPRKSAVIRLENEADEWNTDLEKPEDKLFDEEDVDGGTIFSFRTPKRHNGMVAKANESVTKVHKRPMGEEKQHGSGKQEPKTPERLSQRFMNILIDEAPPKTPYELRRRLRQRIAIEAEKQELDRLLEDSGSEYNPSFSDTDSDSSESETEAFGNGYISPVNEKDMKQHSPAKKKRQQLKDYVFSSDDYFDRRYTKMMTSNNTLKKLRRPKLGRVMLESLLKKIPKTHVESYKTLQNSIESCYKRWIFAMSEGYNIMLYGLGSKRQILANFHARYLKQCFTIDVHGYFPDNMFKEVLVSIATVCLKMTNIPSQPHEIIETIREKMRSKAANRVFLLVSNLDGKMIQNDKTQTLISQLVSLPKIHMVATVDHINCPLLWDQRKLSAFNFIWEDVTTYQPYTEETSYEGSLMVNWSGGIAISSLKNVFASLTVNSRKVFKILLKYHLENHGPKYSGMHFSDLYRECRAGFVVSSDLTLRTLLTEFIDHELVKWKKETDHLVITVDIPVLKQFQAEMDSIGN